MKLGKPLEQIYYMGKTSAIRKLSIIHKEKDIWVTIDDKLTFKEHVAVSTAKAELLEYIAYDSQIKEDSVKKLKMCKRERQSYLAI